MLRGYFFAFGTESWALVADGVPCGFARALGVVGGLANALGVLGRNAVAFLVGLPVAAALRDVTAFHLAVTLGVFAFIVDEASAALVALFVAAASGVQALKWLTLGFPCCVGFALICPRCVGAALFFPLDTFGAFSFPLQLAFALGAPCFVFGAGGGFGAAECFAAILTIGFGDAYATTGPHGTLGALGMVGGLANALGVLGRHAVAFLIGLPVAAALRDITAFHLAVTFGVFAFVADEASTFLVALFVAATSGVQALKRLTLGFPRFVGFALAFPRCVGFALVMPLQLAAAFRGDKGFATVVALICALGAGSGLVLKAQFIGLCVCRNGEEEQHRKCGDQRRKPFFHQKLLGLMNVLNKEV